MQALKTVAYLLIPL